MTQKHQQISSRLVVTAAVVAVVAVIALLFLLVKPGANKSTDNFQSCKDAGGAILESYPERCMIDGKSFTNDKQSLGGDTNSYIGLAEQAALSKAKANNTPARVVERDGESLPMTMDYVPSRLNLSVKDGKVYKVQIEGSES